MRHRIALAACPAETDTLKKPIQNYANVSFMLQRTTHPQTNVRKTSHYYENPFRYEEHALKHDGAGPSRTRRENCI